ncbi:DUF6049 family protein [Streptomyces sp. ID05-04B]|uniref:DUF6049 family protein n=1 Tax=unclassified Streptomyces TaxID=2593676 RepID=UPI000D1B258E|nr:MULTISPECIES: DUF6049 family protein [unclassified Streptomyces]AVV41629.1 hypothetical protein C6376_09450 [Streptomyces sp. P3]MDX5562809.1 DUF6049 family protein [Streptomyces sp. ID05-04B]
MAEAADFPGMHPSPARRWLRRTGALLAGAPLLAGLLQLPAQAAGQSGVKDSSDAGTVAVAVDSLTPAAPGDGDTVTVSGTVTNNGKQTVTDAHVGLSVGSPLTTRSAIDSAADHTDALPADGTEVGGKYVAEFTRLTPGVAEHFTIAVPVAKLDLDKDGVYPLSVTLSGETSARQWEQVLGVQRTFLPWQPDTADTRTRTTVLWPLTSGVHMTAETGSNAQQTPVFLNDDLAREIAPGGRLDQLLSLGRALDVTWVIDPDLLASVDAMTGSYRIRGEGDTTTAGTRQAVAKQWLADLQSAVTGKEVVALPFADPDLASLAHNGTGVTGSLNQLKAATDVAATTVETVLHVTPSTDFAWPVEGAVDPSIVKVATSAGADKVIARSDSLTEGDLSYTPSAARPIGGGTTAVVADARLSTAFQGDLTRASATTLAVQEFLAQSLELNLQTDKQRSIVVAPERMQTASQARALAQALTTLQTSTWSQSQQLTAAAKAKPDPRASTTVPSKKAYPSALRKQQLPRSAFEQMAETQEELDNFKVILAREARVVTPFGRAINREMSTSWRGRSTAASAFRQSVRAYLDTLTGQVKLIDKSDTKLSGRSAMIPVTVQNNLVQGVDHLILRLTSTNPTRLEIGGDDYTEQRVTVSGGHTSTVKFTTSANVNGQTRVIAQLYTEDGRKYGTAVAFEVKVTEITATVMLVIGGGVLLLVLAGFRMYTHRKRAAARETEEPDEARETGETGSGPAGEPPAGPENPGDSVEHAEEESGVPAGVDGAQQPSDGTPDTGAESAEPSGTGERVDR